MVWNAAGFCAPLRRSAATPSLTDARPAVAKLWKTVSVSVKEAPYKSTRILMIIGALARSRADIGAEIAMDLPVAVSLAV